MVAHKQRGVSYTDVMFETRLATAEDAELIATQRRAMFVEMGESDDARMAAMVVNFIPWVRERLKSGTYVGWLREEDGRVVAGGGMLLMDFPPHFLDSAAVRAYLLNFYVDPAFRGRGYARELLETAVGDARRRGIKVVSLHASKFGRPLYESSGFEATNEMRLWSDGGQPD